MSKSMIAIKNADNERIMDIVLVDDKDLQKAADILEKSNAMDEIHNKYFDEEYRGFFVRLEKAKIDYQRIDYCNIKEYLY